MCAPDFSNARPVWLAAAHARLDAAVFDAYAWPHALSDAGFVRVLLQLK